MDYMKPIFYPLRFSFFCIIFLFSAAYVSGQSCPVAVDATISAFPNTYYPGESSPATNATSITLGAVPSGYGTTPIAAGDIVLIIQMQGAQINSSNSDSYGDGVSGGFGNGYTTTGLVAGKMEYAMATNSVPLTGGTLMLNAGLVNSYTRSVYGINGRYCYQVIRVPYYLNLTLGATIIPPFWNDSLGGVVVLDVYNNLNFNLQTINASGAGFRGGGGRSLGGGDGANTDYVTLSTATDNASKGEGIAGTPRYINNNGVLLDNGSSQEGYPGGSYAQGAPGNAGGGGTDGYQHLNTDNSGGGGGGNGGAGGKGGNSWSSNLPVGGEPGAAFSQTSPALLVMGGGGGAGTSNNATGTPPGFASSGSAGGGIVIITCPKVSGTGIINVNGLDANNTALNDGSGGGGAGGSVLLISGSSLSSITITATGGIGGSNNPGMVSASYHGPGGGGGGGVVYTNFTLNAASSVSAGAHGTSTASGGTIAYGSFSGSAGILNQAINSAQLSTIIPSCNGLPVKLVNFSATLNASEVDLRWQIASESGLSNFEIERSTDAMHFVSLGNMSYENGMQDYKFIDHNPASGSDFYRLKMIDENGQFEYSNILLVNLINTNSNQLIAYPNPASVFVTLQFNSDNAVQLAFELFDNSGRRLISKNFFVAKGLNYFSIPDIGNLSKGIYILKASNENKIFVQKLVISK
jgi:hypothetical protein